MNSVPAPEELRRQFEAVQNRFKPAKLKKLFNRPVIIVSTPRSGSTLLYETLAGSPDLWTIGGESHIIYSAFPRLIAENAQMDSGCLAEAHAEKNTVNLMRAGFLYNLRDRQGMQYLNLPRKPDSIRFLEKTPRNALNIPFLRKVFPDAMYIFLHREARQNISSIMDAWQRPNFITFPNLPGWSRQHWHLLLPPGWREMNGKSIAEIAAFQWRMSNLIMLNDLKSIPANRWTSVSYEKLVENPGEEIRRLCKFSGIRPGEQIDSMISSPLPLSSTTVTPPDPDKWKKYEQEINSVIPSVDDVSKLLAALP